MEALEAFGCPARNPGDGFAAWTPVYYAGFGDSARSGGPLAYAWGFTFRGLGRNGFLGWGGIWFVFFGLDLENGFLW